MTEHLVSQTAVDPTEEASRRRRFQQGAAFVFEDIQDAGREGMLDRLRDAEPLSWVPSLGGGQNVDRGRASPHRYHRPQWLTHLYLAGGQKLSDPKRFAHRCHPVTTGGWLVKKGEKEKRFVFE